MKKIFIGVLTAILLTLGFSTSASADKAAEFDVTTEGIALHEGVTFNNQHNIHLDYISNDGKIHRIRGNDLTGPAGGSFVSWADLGVSGGKVVFVHVTGLGKWEFHKGVPVGPKPATQEENQERVEYAEREVTKCPDQNIGYGYITTVRDTVTIFEKRTTIDYTWDASGLSWVPVWSEWEETGREVSNSEEITQREMTDAEYEACGLPPTGAPLLGAGIVALLLLAGGGALAFRKRN